MSLDMKTKATDNGATTLVISGEVDVSNAEELGRELDTLLNDSSAQLIIDMSAVPYIDSTGIGVLMASAKKAQSQQSTLTVSSPQPNVLRVFTMLGVVEEFNISE